MDANAANSPDQDISSGTYILRELIKDLPLSSSDDVPAHITTADAWNGHLYIGTSKGEVLHYVSLPPDPSDPTSEASYIFASQLQPPFTTAQEGRDEGVKQILLLPQAEKVSILCNGTVSFYGLPELSPAYGGKIQQANCSWVGGLDLDLFNDDQASEVTAADPVIVLCLKSRLRMIKLGTEAARKIRDIELGGVSAIQRRGDLACVADGNIYSLLDVINHRKNDLFPISSLSVQEVVDEPKPAGTPQKTSHGASRSVSAATPARQTISHERNVSVGGESKSREGSPWPDRSSSRRRPSVASTPKRDDSPAKAIENPAASTEEQTPSRQPSRSISQPLPPNIVSPNSNEFLLTTGTNLSDPGVGLVVNRDGDPSGGTIEFSSYPESLVLDGVGQSAEPDTPGDSTPEGYVLAVVRQKVGDGVVKAIEVQRWNSEDSHPWKEWITVGSSDDDVEKTHVGMRTATTSAELVVPEISTSLRLRRLTLTNESSEDEDDKRNQEEDKFAARFSQVSASVLLYTNDRVSWVTKNPLILHMERQLASAVQNSANGELGIDVPGVQTVINSIRGQEARTELEFVTLTYIRQKASLLLFGNLVLQTVKGVNAYERDKRFAEEALVVGDIDPRVILSLVPILKDEIKHGKEGIWIAQGLRDTVTMLQRHCEPDSIVTDHNGPYGENILAIIRQYFFTLRQKKGFGSVSDEAHVFQTVDATLLHILLLLDQDSPRGVATPGEPSIRAELNDLVDRGVDCFDRAVQLFEQFHRLYMLSRLYQKKKLSAQVLATWKRILEGEEDAGGELVDGEHDVRRYLSRIRDRSLVQEYGAWLAQRNPKLGVQVFAEEDSRVKFEPAEAVSILKEKAPGAVKDYLEHLVFDKHHVQYVNDLITFYLDTVLAELEKPEGEAKSTLLQSYETYRALKPPKPTYRQFITDNALDAEWWRNRLRLLQLIGGSHGAASKYDVHSLRERLAPYSSELVPEMIILNGREGKHEEALRLLTHGLGDYDTAIRYCLLGGSSIFHPSSGLAAADQPILPEKEEQAHLFEVLLLHFLQLEDVSDRLERTAELLERFGGWFDVAKVLELIPDGWSVELVSGFLGSALRALVRERNETVVVKALVGAQNLKRSVEVVEKIEALGPVVVMAGEQGVV
ncbi:TGF beta receptor associated protein [Neohortaea acidophila]|uniref:TGF beta receptor associated protein n=1 Tax=Neohortaea acidophila TaxID=245834 RepID=A0A6A6PLH6_9PEZI|nr:TGF beta receptor associated protein [Neohortaea acidophila]KAF2480889.1 TGF beta receptor associated protein [Neohortaea acidophila]